MKPPFPRPVAIVMALIIPVFQARAEDLKPAPPAAPPAIGRALSLDVLMATFDKDHDGRISKAEAEGANVTRFSEWDANGDGFATRKEIRTFRLRMGIDDNGQRVADNQITSRPGPLSAKPMKSALILRDPSDWRLETMPIPPGFAPDVKLSGFEEIRFAPGMFDNKAADYFTCVLAITAEGAKGIGSVELQDFLEKYYRGLSTSRAKSSGTAPNIAEMKAQVAPVPDAPNHFTAQVVFFDSFSDGRKITLNVEAEVIASPDTKKAYVILLVSPTGRDDKLWKGLRETGRKAALNVAPAK